MKSYLKETYILHSMVKALLLLSSGIDSPVAGYLMKKKGVDVIAIHFQNHDDKRELEKVKLLKEKIGIKKLYLIPYNEIQSEFLNNCQSKYQCILCKRFMFRIAERIANEEKCDFMITGNNLGQVASQTLENIYTTNQAVKIKIIDPLLTNDKQESIDIARKIGTYDISSMKCSGCPFVPDKPVTKATITRLEHEESRIDIEELIEKGIKNKKIV